ncbi:MAG: putative rane protein [Paenibacillus sp.]|nr:putative rane protein [Paenibacillus sp.]
MKAIKYIISFFILFTGILIIGESHIFRLNNFLTEFDNTTLYLQPGTTDEEMVKDILDSAVRNEVEVFAAIRSPRSTFLTEFDIYGTSGVEQFINEHSNIFAGSYPSLFLGDIQFAFDQFPNLPGIAKIHDYYLIGSKAQVNQFKMDLIDKYAGNHPMDGYEDKESRNLIVSIWLLMISIILLLSYYDVVFQKKENLIRVSMGERINKIIWKNILLDTVVLGTLFASIIYILSKFTSVYFGFTISLFLFIILLLLNALLYLNLYFYNLKEVFSNVRGSKKLLSLNYGLKLVTSIITIFIISSNVALIVESYSLYKQKSFFEDHAEYDYNRLNYRLILSSEGSIDSLGDSAVVQDLFYRQFIDKFDATLLASMDGLLNGKGIWANKNVFDYLSSEIKELRELTLNKTIYFILPAQMSGDPKILDEMKDTVRFYEGDYFTYDYEVIYYKDDVEIIRIDENHLNGSELVENPLIILNNSPSDALTNQIEVDFTKITYLHEVMYNISSEDEFNRFIEDHNLKDQIVTRTNAFDNYNAKWTIAQRVLYMNFIFSILVLLLEFIIISSIIKLEYEVNAIELSIKKVMGHSMLAKNSKIIGMTVITTLLSILGAVIVAVLLKLDGVTYLAAGGMVILLLELCVITVYIFKIENAKIQKILKGGNI